MRRFRQKNRYALDHLGRNGGGIGVAGARLHIAITAPRGPLAQQQPLFIGASNKVLEWHLVKFLRRGGNLPQISTQHAMAEFIGELKPLYQPVPQLLIARFAKMPIKAFAQPPDRVDQGVEIDRPVRRASA